MHGSWRPKSARLPGEGWAGRMVMAGACAPWRWLCMCAYSQFHAGRWGPAPALFREARVGSALPAAPKSASPPTSEPWPGALWVGMETLVCRPLGCLPSSLESRARASAPLPVADGHPLVGGHPGSHGTVPVHGQSPPVGGSFPPDLALGLAYLLTVCLQPQTRSVCLLELSVCLHF